MKPALLFIAKATLFFALVGGMVGMLAILPFADRVLVHRSIWGAEFLPIFLMGFFLFAAPIAGSTGLIYGAMRCGSVGKYPISLTANLCLGFACGAFIALLIFALADFKISNNLEDRFTQVLFLGLCSMIASLLFERRYKTPANTLCS